MFLVRKTKEKIAFEFPLGEIEISSSPRAILNCPEFQLPLPHILVIQASSAESERHFSAGGMIVSERRNRLSAQSVESLVVLREAFINGQWPPSKSL